MKVGIIGTGEISTYHATFLREIKEVDIVAICDQNISIAREMGERFGIKGAYSDYREMIEKAKPDVVHILTPPMFHARMAVDALKRGCHVLVEKPMALSFQDAVDMVAASEATGKVLSVCEMYHFDPAMIRARHILEEGLIGKIFYMESYWFTNIGESNAYSTKGNGSGWAYSLPGEVFGNFLEHPVYLQRDLLGKVKQVNSLGWKIGNNPFLKYDELRINLIGQETTGCIVASLNGKPRINTLRLYGTEGIMNVDISNMTVTMSKNWNVPSFVSKGINNLSQSYGLVRDTVATSFSILCKKIKARQGLRSFIKEFYMGLSSSTPHRLLDAKKALETVKLVNEIWNSLAANELEAKHFECKHVNTFCLIDSNIDQADKRPRILVTGASGFLGRYLVNELLKNNVVVRVMIRKIDKTLEENSNVEIVYGDVRNAECVDQAVNGVNTIYHLASITTNRGSWQRFEETNVNGTRNLLEAACRFGVDKFVFVSSVVIYGFNKRKDKLMVSEHDGYGVDLVGYSYYARSKVEADKLVTKYYKEKGLNTVILRPGIIFGPGGKNVLKDKYLIFGAKHKTWPYIYVKNVIDALLLAGSSRASVGQAYNVVADEQPTQGAFVGKIKQYMKTRGVSFFTPTWMLYLMACLFEFLSARKHSDTSPPFGKYHYRAIVRNLVYDNSKIKNDLGWRPAISIDEGIRQTIKYFRPS